MAAHLQRATELRSSGRIFTKTACERGLQCTGSPMVPKLADVDMPEKTMRRRALLGGLRVPKLADTFCSSEALSRRGKTSNLVGMPFPSGSRNGSWLHGSR